jgi:hypothetical protein
MKVKLRKKLVLNRETLRLLDAASLRYLIGGAPETGPGVCTTIIATDCESGDTSGTGPTYTGNTCTMSCPGSPVGC